MLLAKQNLFFSVILFSVVVDSTAKTVEFKPTDKNKVLKDSVGEKETENNATFLQNNFHEQISKEKLGKIKQNHTATDKTYSGGSHTASSNGSFHPIDFKVSGDKEQQLPLELSSEPPKNESYIEFEDIEISVTSQPLLLTGMTENESNFENEVFTEASVNVSEIQVTTASALTSYPEIPSKGKVRPSYHSYIAEILSTENPTDMEASSLPSRIKQGDYATSHDTPVLASPYGKLPTFSEKELGKLRLNHWRVNQIYKGSVDVQAEKLGLPGTRKSILHDKYPYPIIGQKRTVNTNLGDPTYLDDSASDALSSLLASADSLIPVQLSSSPQVPTNFRTFLSWFTGPPKKTSPEEARQANIRAQQAILPFALDYRGDFLNW